MNLVFRETLPSDVDQMFVVRASTRQNAIPREHLATMGITSESIIRALENGEMKSWVCASDSKIVGFCSGATGTGEVLVLAVQAEYEGLGIGKRLLSMVVNWLKSIETERIWLAACPDPKIRAHGFYRSQGWLPTGNVDKIGDEILVYEDKRLWHYNL